MPKMCGFQNPLPQKEQPLLGVEATFWTIFLHTMGPDVPSSGGGSRPCGRPDRRAAEEVDFLPKNKVERLSPSTSRIFRQVWPHLRTTLGLALPSPRRTGRIPLNFYLCIGLEIAKTPEPLVVPQKRDQFWKALHLGYLNLKQH